jgi:hypothetical protein
LWGQVIDNKKKILYITILHIAIHFHLSNVVSYMWCTFPMAQSKSCFQFKKKEEELVTDILTESKVIQNDNRYAFLI